MTPGEKRGEETMSQISGSGAPQMKLTLKREVTPIRKSPPTVGEGRKETAIPTAHLVGGAKVKPPHLTQAKLVPTSTHKVSKSPPALTQTHLKTKILPAIPKLKSDVLSGGSMVKSLSSEVLLKSLQLQLEQNQRLEEKKHPSHVSQAKLPPPLIKLLSKAQSKPVAQVSSTNSVTAKASALSTVPSSSKPVLAGSSSSKPVLAGSSSSKPVLAGSSSSKPVLAGSSSSKPVLAGSSSSKLVLAGSSASSKPTFMGTKPKPAFISKPIPRLKDSTSPRDEMLPPKAKRIKTAQLPMSRVKTIMKTNIQSSQPAPQLSQESVLVVTKAAVRV